jgi:hypothetical protein
MGRLRPESVHKIKFFRHRFRHLGRSDPALPRELHVRPHAYLLEVGLSPHVFRHLISPGSECSLSAFCPGPSGLAFLNESTSYAKRPKKHAVLTCYYWREVLKSKGKIFFGRMWRRQWGRWRVLEGPPLDPDWSSRGMVRGGGDGEPAFLDLPTEFRRGDWSAAVWRATGGGLCKSIDK